jgi:hypothetical protein
MNVVNGLRATEYSPGCKPEGIREEFYPQISRIYADLKNKKEKIFSHKGAKSTEKKD